MLGCPIYSKTQWRQELIFVTVGSIAHATWMVVATIVIGIHLWTGSTSAINKYAHGQIRVDWYSVSTDIKIFLETEDGYSYVCTKQSALRNLFITLEIV